MANHNVSQDYDREEEYRKKIAPLVRDIKLHCMGLGIPMFCTFAVKNDKDGTKYLSDMVFATTKRHLEENKIAKLLLYFNDFKKEYPDYINNDIRELQEYIEREHEAEDQPDTTETELDDEQIRVMQQIVDGNKDVKIRSGVTDKSIEDDFLDDFS